MEEKMKKEIMKKEINWVGLGILGVIGAGIVGIWKSSKIGKLIFILLTLLIIFGIGAWGIGKLSDVYYGKIRYRQYLVKNIKPIKEKLDTLKEDIAITKEKLRNINTRFTEDYNNLLEKEVEKVSKKLNGQYDDIQTKFEEVEKALDLIQEEERKELKKRIIYLKEDVIVHEKSIESAVIRIRCEEIADKLFLLTQEEIKRFHKELKDIGFEVEQEEQGYTTIMTNSYSVMSCDTLSWGTSSSDIATLQRRRF